MVWLATMLHINSIVWSQQSLRKSVMISCETPLPQEGLQLQVEGQQVTV